MGRKPIVPIQGLDGCSDMAAYKRNAPAASQPRGGLSFSAFWSAFDSDHDDQKAERPHGDLTGAPSNSEPRPDIFLNEKRPQPWGRGHWGRLCCRGQLGTGSVVIIPAVATCSRLLVARSRLKCKPWSTPRSRSAVSHPIDPRKIK